MSKNVHVTLRDLAEMSFDDVTYLNELLDGYEAAEARVNARSRRGAES